MSETTKPTYRVVKPRVDIVERENELLLYAEMAGVSAEAIDITLEQNQLTLHGQSDALNKTYQRAFTLSNTIDRDNIDAHIANGVLTLTLPKLEPVNTVTQIAVKAA